MDGPLLVFVCEPVTERVVTTVDDRWMPVGDIPGFDGIGRQEIQFVIEDVLRLLVNRADIFPVFPM